MNECLYENKIEYSKIEVDLYTVLIALALAMFFLCFAVTQFGESLTAMEAITFSLNGIILYLMWFRGLVKFSFSIDLIHSLFCLLFFWIAPVLQVSSGFYTGKLQVYEDDVVRANVFIFVWLVFYNVGVLLSAGKTFKAKQFSYGSVSTKFVFLVLLAIVIIAVNDIRKNGFDFSRNSFVELETHSLGLLINHCLTALVTFGTIFVISWSKNTKRSKIYIIVSIACLLLSCFPTAMSRYATGSIYCCLCLTLFPSLRKKHRIIVIMLLGMIVLFPVMDLYRYKSFSQVSFTDIKNQISNVTEYFSSGHYDAYQMIIAATRLVDYAGYSYGYQLLGALLFFVPRQFWPTKPVGTGAYIAQTLGWQFSNVSCPYIGEAYVNFGVPGIILLSLFLGYIVNRMDNSYWYGDKTSFSFVNLAYFYVVPYFLFACRGDMMSTLAYFCANMFVAFMIAKLSEFSGKIKHRFSR